ncbi:hypothetical protein KBD45_02955 [Candidatus Dojkabacteria bacterium]|nr:hypothetical protein [Chitinophagales bacterium]MBP9758629.1 hypothetical protein [Candidatus Dojkabacteria bacterium]
MMLLKNGIDLNEKVSAFINDATNLYIYSAFIKLETLKLLLDKSNEIQAVFVRWQARDLITGSSDLEIYPYLFKKGISLYRNERLHIKAYINDFKSCLFTTANISSRGLNEPSRMDYNYEIGGIINRLSIQDRLYFQIIESESLLITDSVFNQFTSQLPLLKNKFPSDMEFQIDIESPDANFLISSLPMSYNVNTLIRIYESNEYINEVELNCALHDLALYKIPLGLSKDEFIHQLKKSFFAHPFINAFLTNLLYNNEIYFGTAKAWIQKKCANVPTPRRFEITENIQILFKWMVDLGDGRYGLDTPNYSQRLFLV